jgi:hypothetical protein
MMRGQNIVCFAKEWREDPTSNNHIMRVLARTNRVLWIISISMRTPSVASWRDLKKIAVKLGRFARGVEHVDESPCGCSRRSSCRCRTVGLRRSPTG